MRDDLRDVPISDAVAGGPVYKMYIPDEGVRDRSTADTAGPAPAAKASPRRRAGVSYLLLEFRERDAHTYNRGIPAEGLLVWKVREGSSGNQDESSKIVDLVCADGTWTDGGYPGGTSHALQGGDNLDFWAHDPTYRQRFGGNLGDATDPFDGVRHSRISITSNPSAMALGDFLPSAVRPFEIRMRPTDRGMRLDIDPVRWAGTIDEDLVWGGEVLVDGDITITPAGSLSLLPGMRAWMAPVDELRAGLDPDRIELTIDGGLNAHGAPPARLEAYDPMQPWFGVVVDDPQASDITVYPNSLEIEGASYALVTPQWRSREAAVRIESVEFDDRFAGLLAGNGDGRMQPGETVAMRITVSNPTLVRYGANVASSDSPLLRSSQGIGVRASSAALRPGGRHTVLISPTTVGRAAKPGDRITLRMDTGYTIPLTISPGPTVPQVRLVPGEGMADGVVIAAAKEKIRVEVQSVDAARLSAVELIMRHASSHGIVQSSRAIAADGGFVGRIQPGRLGDLELMARVRGADGGAGFSDPLPVHVPVVSWQDVLVLFYGLTTAEQNRSRPSLIDAIYALDKRSSVMSLDPGDPVSAAVLDRYLAADRIVAVIGRNLSPQAVSSLESFVRRGGRLLMAGLHLLPGRGSSPLLAGARVSDGSVATLVVPGQMDEFTQVPHTTLQGLPDSATPLLEDGEGRPAGFAAPLGEGFLAYLSLDLAAIERRHTRCLLTDLIDRLRGDMPRPDPATGPDSERAGFAIVDVEGLTPTTPVSGGATVHVLNCGTQRAGFEIIERLSRSGRPVFQRSHRQPFLEGGSIRQVELSDWTRLGEVDVDVRLIVRGADGDADTLIESISLADVPDRFRQEPLDAPLGNGAGLFDVDGDGDLDLYLVRLGSDNRLYRNEDGQLLADTDSDLQDDGRGRGLAIGDPDNDGDIDVYLVNEGPNKYFLNDGYGDYRRVDRNQDRAQSYLADNGSGRSAGFFDMDGDGDLDLYLVNATDVEVPGRSRNRMFRNDLGLFTEIGEAAGVADAGNGRGLAVGDYDGDGDSDFFVANQSADSPSELYRNEGGRFLAVRELLGITDAPSDVAPAFGDVDDDGDLDLLLSREAGDNQLFRNLGGTRFEPVAGARLGAGTVGAAFLDYDNDGGLDVLTTSIDGSRGGDQIFHNRGLSGFAPAGSILGMRDTSTGRGLTTGDLDEDGAIDIVVADYGGTVLYRGSARALNWLRLRLDGSPANAAGVGARARVLVDGRWQYREMHTSYGYGSQVQPLLHFGLSSADAAQEVRIDWTDGQQSRVYSVRANQELVVGHPGALTSRGALTRRRQDVPHPNPFNAQVVIPLTLPAAQHVDVNVYNTTGQRVRSLLSGPRPAGQHRLLWDGRSRSGDPVGTGVYYVRILTADVSYVERVLLLK